MAEGHISAPHKLTSKPFAPQVELLAPNRLLKAQPPAASHPHKIVLHAYNIASQRKIFEVQHNQLPSGSTISDSRRILLPLVAAVKLQPLGAPSPSQGI